jgi:Holliday junction resolvase RusA-like endonuclease
MIKIIKLGIEPKPFRIGWVNVQYHDIVIRCSICVFKEEKIYIRMPEMFVKDEKLPYVFWQSKKDSDNFQKEVLKALKLSIGLDLKKAVELKREGHEKKKEGDKNKKSI